MEIKRFNVDMSVYKYFKQVSSLNVLLVNLCKLSGNTNKTKTSSFLSELSMSSQLPRGRQMINFQPRTSVKSYFAKLVGKVLHLLFI